jgi:hypothetical protein
MPRTNIDYYKTTIYKICCKNLDITKIYIGNTTDMRKRKYEHKSCCINVKNKHYNLKVYQFIRENGGWDNWDMIEIEKYNAIDGYDAKKRERYWIEELKATLNIDLPSRTRKQWVEDNKEIIAEKKKEYQENNKEKLKEYKKEYRENNKQILSEKKKEKITCDCGCEISKYYLKEHQQSKKHINLMSQKSISSIIT